MLFGELVIAESSADLDSVGGDDLCEIVEPLKGVLDDIQRSSG